MRQLCGEGLHEFFPALRGFGVGKLRSEGPPVPPARSSKIRTIFPTDRRKIGLGALGRACRISSYKIIILHPTRQVLFSIARSLHFGQGTFGLRQFPKT